MILSDLGVRVPLNSEIGEKVDYFSFNMEEKYGKNVTNKKCEINKIKCV